MRMRYHLHKTTQRLLDPNVRLRLRGAVLRPWWRWRFAAFGDESVLVGPRWIVGARKISVGQRATIFPGAWLAAESSTWSQPGPALVIGEGCLIRDDVVLSASESIVLEEHVTLAGRVTVIDSDHTWADGHPLITDNRSVTAPIRIGRGSWIAEQSIILRGTEVGVFCIVAANSVVRGSFPDFSLIAGSPARVVGSTLDRVPPALRPDGGQA